MSETRRTTYSERRTLIVLALTFLAGAVEAVPTFNDSVLVTGASFCSTDCRAGGDSATPRSSSITERSFPWTASATSSSDVGFLETSTSASRVDGIFGGFAAARATPFLLLDELIITKLPGFEGLPDTLRVGFEATFDYFNSTVGFAGANDLTINGGINSISNSLGAFTSTTSGTVGAARTVFVGSPFFLHVRLDVDTAVSGFVASSELASVRLDLDTFALFDLPDGYTVNGASGLVVDNVLGGATHAVPAPPAFTLLAFGFVGVLRFAPSQRRSS